MLTQGELTVSPTKTSTSKTFESPEEFLIHLTEINRLNKIQEYLKNHPDFDIMKVIGPRQYSLIHTACLNNQLKLCELFFSHLKSFGSPAPKIRSWLNTQTEEGFTPIHFASFKGNIELIKLLENHGADFALKNNQGLSVAHIAAQGDQPASLAYFREKGISIYERDTKGSTPLHWATFLGMENATNFLTAWGCPTNEKDVESGFTSLHLAVLSGNARVVRRVLIKGGDKTITDKEGRQPIAIAIENGYENIIQLLKGKGWLIEFLNIKPSFQKKRNKKSLVSFAFLYVAFNAVNVIFVFPYVESLAWVITYSILILFTISMFLLAWLTDPGYLHNPRKNDVLNLLINNEPNTVCPECVIVKPPRSRHCEYCNQCVAVCDHHCPWIDNCVGARNHRYFITFTLSITMCLIFLVAFSIAHIGSSIPIYAFSNPNIYSSDHSLFIAKEIICAADLGIGVMFIFPLLALNFVQIGNFMSGRTTNERFGFKATGKDQKDQQKNSLLSASTVDSSESLIVEPPRNAACLFNCRAMCITNARDSRYHYQPLGHH